MLFPRLRPSEKRRLLEQVRDELEQEHRRRAKVASTLSKDESIVFLAHLVCAWGNRWRKRAESQGGITDADSRPDLAPDSDGGRLLAKIEELEIRCEELEQLGKLKAIEKFLGDRGLLPVLLPPDVMGL